MHLKVTASFIGVTLLALCTSVPALASQVRVTAQNAVIYEYKDGRMTPVARAPHGYRLTVNDPPKGAWYSLNWPAPEGGTKTAWIPVRDVEITEAGAAQSNAAARGASPAAGAYRKWFAQVGMSGAYMAPSNLQGSAGFLQSPQFGYRFGGEIGYLPWRSISTAIRVEYLSISAIANDASGASFNVTGPTFSLAGDYLFIHNDRVRLGLGVQAGALIGRSNVVDTTPTTTATSFFAFDGGPRLIFKYLPWSNVGFYAEANYRVVFPLGAVPLSATGTSTLQTDLNGVGGGAGITFVF